MMNQKQAVMTVFLSYFPDYQLNGPVRFSEIINSDDKKKFKADLFKMFREGKVQYSEEFAPKVKIDSELNKYITGLVDNWIRKEPTLNSGERYEIKNKGSRAGSGDAELKNLKILLEQVKGTKNEAVVQAAIEKRQEELKPKAAEINVSALPENLRHLVK